MPLELPACSQHVSKDAALVLQRMLSRTWWAQSSLGPSGTSTHRTSAWGVVSAKSALELELSVPRQGGQR